MEPRKTCILCACKHLAQARALLLELKKGYPEHFWFSLGNLAEAEDELVVEFPELANRIRGERKQLEMYPKYMPDFKQLVLDVATVGGYDVDKILDPMEEGTST